ncbi:ice-binding family protein [Streptomyces sp. MOE7]|uniref:ice-binding family protein n=1 Tax=Streptomyces sp. MOE7 TaxID=1961713 RepID=UPI000A03E31C|nr:ice-binding family protein [Streptomyces sp. MOE7]
MATNLLATAPVPLGTAASFAVLAGSTVTNTGATVVNGDLGLSPGVAVTGFPPGTVTGTIHVNDATAATAKNDLLIAYTNAVGRPVTATVATELGGTTLTPGVYNSASGTFTINGTLTLDGQGDPNAVFIFQTASTLITGAASNVTLINAAQSGNVFWQVGSSATLGANSTLRGSILALTSITVTTGATVDGRTLAASGAVTLDTNTINRPAVAQATTTTLTSAPDPSGFGQPKVLTATVTAASGTPTGTVTFFDGATPLGSAPLNGSGVATLTVSTLSPGSHSLLAVYGGSANFTSSISPVDVQTVTSDRTQLTASPALLKLFPFPHLEYPFLSAKLTDLDTGQPIPGQVLTFTTGGAFLGTAVTDATGTATLSNPLALIPILLNGGYNVTYAGTPGHQPASAHGGIIVA